MKLATLTQLLNNKKNERKRKREAYQTCVLWQNSDGIDRESEQKGRSAEWRRKGLRERGEDEDQNFDYDNGEGEKEMSDDD